jgi:hypothetical protein
MATPGERGGEVGERTNKIYLKIDYFDIGFPRYDEYLPSRISSFAWHFKGNFSKIGPLCVSLANIWLP